MIKATPLLLELFSSSRLLLFFEFLLPLLPPLFPLFIRTYAWDWQVQDLGLELAHDEFE